MSDQTERRRRIEENQAALRATFASMHETNAQIRALFTEQQQGLARASQALGEASVILDRIEQRNADNDEERPCPTCGGTGDCHQIGCQGES